MRARLAAVVVACLVLLVAPLNLDGPWPSIASVAAEHLTLDPGARPLAARPFDGDVNVRVDDHGIHVGGRLSGFGHSLGVWLRGQLRERGVTLDGQLQGDQTFNFRLDADTERGLPRLRIETYPGTL